MHPIIGSFGPIQIHAYGLLVAIGVLAAMGVLRATAPKAGISADLAMDGLLLVVLLGFISARVFYVLGHWDYFRGAPLEAFEIWRGGVVLYGGMAGGTLALYVIGKLNKISTAALLDLFLPAVALAQGFGRIGCFLNGCCYGKETNLPWGVQFPSASHPVHPTQIYESVFCFALAGFLFWLVQKKPPRGVVAAAYFFTYAVGRFVIEFFRGDHAKTFHSLTLPQILSVALALLSLSLLSVLIRNGKTGTDRPF